MKDPHIAYCQHALADLRTERTNPTPQEHPYTAQELQTYRRQILDTLTHYRTRQKGAK